MIVKLSILHLVLFVFTITSGAPRPQNDQIFFPDTDLEDRYFDPPNNNQNQNRPNRPDRLPNLNQWFTNPSRPSSTRPPFRRTTQRPVIPSAIGPRPSRCETSCLTTPEYNPVCGSDSVTYNNLGRLRCAAGCGKNVEMVFYGRCSPLLPGLRQTNNRF